jgi:hypothetical protein
LTLLYSSSNNFSEQDLSIFSNFVNLEVLYVSNDDERKIQRNIYNRFIGSLEHLQNLTRLEILDISNTDIDSGLGHLPLNKLTLFSCSNKGKKEAKVAKIYAICGKEGIAGFDKEKLVRYQVDLRKSSQKNKKEVASGSQVDKKQLIITK